MKIRKFIFLNILLLSVMLLLATATMKIFDLLFKFGYENIWKIGFKVGFIAWLFFGVITGIAIFKRKNKQ